MRLARMYTRTSTVVMETTVGASPRRMACQSVPPTPLMLKMPSVMMAPPMRAPRSPPRKVATGMRELRRMWRVMTALLARPLARAVRT